MNRMARLQHELYRWSCRQFGSHKVRDANGPANHLSKKEAIELAEAVAALVQARQENHHLDRHNARKHVLEEMADCIMLVLDTASRLGLYWYDIENAIWDKLEKCRNRKWNPIDADGISEHVRDGDD